MFEIAYMINVGWSLNISDMAKPVVDSDIRVLVLIITRHLYRFKHLFQNRIFTVNYISRISKQNTDYSLLN